MSGIGHNGGPEMTAVSWRRHCWGAAREALLPVLPVEVIRTRVKRAAALGLDYKTYAGVRASSGRDVVAFLFSSNALRVTALQPAMAGDQTARLQAIAAGRLGLAVRPLTPGMLAVANPVLDECHPAPHALARWGDARAAIGAALGRLPPDGVVLVGAYGLEADWVAAGKLAAYLPAERFFGGGV